MLRWLSPIFDGQRPFSYCAAGYTKRYQETRSCLCAVCARQTVYLYTSWWVAST